MTICYFDGLKVNVKLDSSVASPNVLTAELEETENLE